MPARTEVEVVCHLCGRVTENKTEKIYEGMARNFHTERTLHTYTQRALPCGLHASRMNLQNSFHSVSMNSSGACVNRMC